MRYARRLAAFAAIGLFASLAGVGMASAQSATWVGGTSGDFDTASNWNPNTAVPTGTASFGTSARTALTFSAGTTNIGGWTFNAGASAYSFDVGSTLTFTGAGIVINGGGASITNDIGGFLSFNNTSTAGSASITNNSPLFFNNSSTAGNASITNNNTLLFNNTSTAGSATIVNNAAVSFNDSSMAGSATLTNNRFLTFNNSSTAGSAGIANTDNSFLTFNNSSTAGSASITTTDVSTLSFNNTSTAGSASITISGVSTLSFNNTSTAGSASITNIGGVSFNDTSTAGSASITNNAGLSFNNTSTAANARITNNSGSLLNFNNSSTAGSATILNNAGGATPFQDTSTAGNATITNVVGGLTKFFTGSTAGNAVINNNGGVTQFDNLSTAGNAIITTNSGGSVFFVNTSSGGQASFITNSGGVFDMSGLTSGGTTAGSIAGAGTFLLGPNQLTVGSNNLSTTVSGVISGDGPVSLIKVGTGTLALTGTNTYTGRTLVNGGTLEVDGSIATSNTVIVNATGTLSGTGEVTRAAIEAGGTLAPGNAANPTGTLTSMINLTILSASFYLVQVGASASNTNVVGTASVNGIVQVAAAGGVQGMKTYDILHSTGIGGTRFSGVQSLTPGFTETLSYSTTDVFLILTANLGGGGSLNGNQRNVANSINSFFNGGGALPQGFVNLFNLSGAPLANALTQISGETATGSQQTTFDAMGLFMGLLTDPFMNRTGDAGSMPGATGYADEALSYAARQKTDAFAMFNKAPPAPFEQGWSVWAAGFGGSQSTSGNAALGSNDTTSRIAGTAVGADYLLSPNTIAGFALAGGGTNFSVANGGTGRSDLFQMGAYVRHTDGPAYISAALAYGWQDITTNRTVTGLDQLRAEFNANAFSGRVEGGYRFVAPATFGIGITPYAAAQFVTFDLPAYAEQAIVGLNTFALSYGARNVTDPRSELGIRTDKPFAMSDGVLILRGRLAWAHDYDPDRSIAATFQSLPGAGFVVNGAAQASDSALATASVEMRWKNGWSAAATFEGEFSGVTQSYAGKGVVRYAW